MDHRPRLGKLGEDAIARWLAEEQGFAIVARNARVGRYELDIIARRGGLLVFCEVRTRSTHRFGSPVETIDTEKVAKTRIGAFRWLKDQPQLRGMRVRFDAAGVVVNQSIGVSIDYYPDAF